MIDTIHPTLQPTTIVPDEGGPSVDASTVRSDLVGLIADKWSLAQSLPNILVLVGFGVVFFAIAVWRFRFE